MRTQDGSGGSGGRMEKPIARAVTFFVSRIQIKHKKIHLALGHTWHSVILGTRSTWHSVILGTRSTWHSVTLGTQSTWHSVTWHSVHLALGPLGTRSTWHSVTWHSVPTSDDLRWKRATSKTKRTCTLLEGTRRWTYSALWYFLQSIPLIPIFLAESELHNPTQSKSDPPRNMD